MARRLALACAILGSPEVLILDEPTTGMDVPSRNSFLDYLANFRKRGGTVLLSSHVLSEVQTVCNGYALLKAGRIVAAGQVRSDKSNGTSRLVVAGMNGEQVQELLGTGWIVRLATDRVIAETTVEMPDLGGVVQRLESVGGTVLSFARIGGIEDVYRREFGA